MKIIAQNDNLSERKYILDIIFDEFLGLKFELETAENSDEWRICLDNGKMLVFKDAFFGKFKGEREYLKFENIPANVSFVKNEFAPEDDIPVLYGDDFMEVSENKITCGIDIFASSFFMLTRWEEYVNKTRDKHDRFPASASLALKFDFLSRPIVNEYVETLKNMLSHLDSNIKFKEHKAQTIVTCDVDQPFDYSAIYLKYLIRSCGGDIFKRHDLIAVLKRIYSYALNKLKLYNYVNDKNNVFSWYVDVCEKSEIKPIFYFIPDNSDGGYNGRYSLSESRIKELLLFLDGKGCELGVHGSYFTYQDADKIKSQKETLVTVLKNLGIKQEINGNRQHYLRWDSSVTPRYLDEADFTYDTTGSYADMAGFRYGVCYEFSMFDFLCRKRLKIKERPLIFMDCSVFEGYAKMEHDVGIKYVKFLKEKCYEFNGNFVVLWHNSNFWFKDSKKIFGIIINA